MPPGRRNENNRVVTAICTGIREVPIRVDDPELAATFVIGALNWIARRNHLDDPCSLGEVARGALMFLRRGLAAFFSVAAYAAPADV
jgi:hypothetical protein